jgi:hypothetical protein
MGKARGVSGGGIESRQRKEVGVKTGSRTLNAINPNRVGGIGLQQVFADGTSGPKLVTGTPTDFVPLGNAVALRKRHCAQSLASPSRSQGARNSLAPWPYGQR